MKNILMLLILLIFSCKDANKHVIENNINNYNKDLEELLTLNTFFPIGDVRRYGIITNKPIGEHKITKKNKLQEIIKLASSGLTITFPQGYYKTSLLLKQQNNLHFIFNNAFFSGSVQLINTKNILLDGELNSYSGLIINNSSNIKIGSILVQSNISKNISNLEATGVQILNKSHHINIQNIVVDGVGYGEQYKFTHAGLKIYGYPNLPNQININNMLIKSSSVHGAIIMGNDIKIKTIEVQKFGFAPINVLSKLSNTRKKQTNYFGVWLIKNTNSVYDAIQISTSENKAMLLDEANLAKPTIINQLILKTEQTIEYTIDDNEKTNIVVKRVKKL